MHKSPTDLSPSQYYKFRLAEACLDSSFGYTKVVDVEWIENRGCIDGAFQLPGPILFIDEWFDVETSEVVKNVQPAIDRIVHDLKGIVICVTHKQQLFYQRKGSTRTLTSLSSQQKQSDLSAPTLSSTTTFPSGKMTTITLSGGKILSIEKP
jgi:hypothetical protein